MNEKKSTNWTAKKLAINALAIALVCVSTMVIQIPIPLGYMHLGNCCILLVSVYFGNMTGMLAGGIGSCLADLLSGYTQWIIPTLIIKGIMGLVIAMIAYREGEEIRMMRLRTFLGAAAGIVTWNIYSPHHSLAGLLAYSFNAHCCLPDISVA